MTDNKSIPKWLIIVGAITLFGITLGAVLKSGKILAAIITIDAGIFLGWALTGGKE